MTGRRRRARPRRSLVRPGMLRRLTYVIGAVVAASGLATVPALVTALLYREWDDALALLGAAAVTIGAGILAWRRLGRQGTLTTREGFAAVGLAWMALTLFGTLPYVFSQSLDGYTNAFFETAAGFTTTGSTTLADPSVLSHSLLIWRATTQWVGGMGIIVLSIAVLPALGVGGIELARAEAPGPEPDRLTPRFRETAKRLWLIYVALTGLEVMLLAIGEMSLFEAVAHGFATMATGGFSTEPTSVAGFDAYTHWVIIVFMLLAGTSFTLHFRALRNPLVYGTSAEFRLFLSIVAVGAVLIAGGVWADYATETAAIRDSVFTSVALVTTTGFVTTDFAQWVTALQALVLVYMFLGAMAGSTSGAIKTLQVGILAKSASASLQRLVHPNAILVPRFGGRPVPEHIVRSIQSFFIFYIAVYALGTFLFGFVEATFGTATVDYLSATSAVASMLNNIGPALGSLGPAGNYAEVTDAGKWLLAFIMIIGRLEVFPVLLLFTRFLWRR